MDYFIYHIFRVFVVWVFLSFFLGQKINAQGNFVRSDAEAANNGTIDLSTSFNWSTDRTVLPGYFSLLGTASFTGGSDIYNIDGYIKHYSQISNQGCIFPVGTGTDIRTLTTSGTISNNLVCATAWILGDPNITLDPTDGTTHNRAMAGPGILSVSAVGQWDWIDFNNNAAGTTVTVSIPDMTSFASASDLRLVGWNGSMWVNLSGVTGANDVVENSILSGTMISGVTALAIGSIGFPLPVILDSFVVSSSSLCEVALSWHTSYQKDVFCFEIQRSSDGSNYSTIGVVQPNDKNSYSFIDYNVHNGNYYYRLKIIDNNSSIAYSKISNVMSLTCSNDFWVNYYPNPSNDQVNIELYNVSKGNINISIIDNLGKLVTNLNMQLNKDNNSMIIPLNIKDLCTGVYNVNIKTSLAAKSIRILKN